MDAITIAVLSRLADTLARVAKDRTGSNEGALAVKVASKFAMGIGELSIIDFASYVLDKIEKRVSVKTEPYRGPKPNGWSLEYSNIFANLDFAVSCGNSHDTKRAILYYKSFYRLGRLKLALPELLHERFLGDPRYKLAVSMDAVEETLTRNGLFT